MNQTPQRVQIAHLLKIVPTSGRRQIAITRDCLPRFFDVYLKDAPPSTLRRLSEYRQVEYSR